jgi:peptidoglycan/LPS O-acetylase OafA/YrhL
MQQGARPRWQQRIADMAAAGCCVAIAVLVVWRGRFMFWDTPVAAVGFALLAIVFGRIVASCANASPQWWLGPLFQNAVVRSLGRYSYMLYLIHLPVARALKGWLFDSGRIPVSSAQFGLLLLATVAVSWLLALLSWHLFERHLLGAKNVFDRGGNPGAHNRDSAAAWGHSVEPRADAERVGE